MPFDELALRLGLALAIGFIIGLERGWKVRGEEEGRRAVGLRTLSLVGLLGGVLGVLSLGGDRLLIASGLLVTGGTLAAFIWRAGAAEKDLSATSLVASILTFVLGAYAVLGDPAVAAGASVATVLLLAHKKLLHGWLERLSWMELRSGLILGAMTFIALPLLPNRAIDPWDAVNPYEIWLMTILIAAISFAGYVAVKVAGPKRGLTLAAALGGLVSSTAVTLSLARLVRRNDSHLRLLAGGILASGCVMMLRVIVIAGLINRELAIAIAPILLAATAITGVVGLFLVRSDPDTSPQGAKGFELQNPFDLPQVLRFGGLLAVIMFATVVVRREFGQPGLLGLSALSGLADVDALTLSVAKLGEVSPLAIHAILITVAVNSIAKAIYAWIAGGSKLGLMLLAATGAAIAVCALILFRT